MNTVPAKPKDIVDKLRGSLGWSKSRDHLCEAAANEIELLRANLEGEKRAAEVGEECRRLERAAAMVLRQIIYKMQLPANYGDEPSEYLTKSELAIYRQAVAPSI